MAVAVELITASLCPSCASAERTLRRTIENLDDRNIIFRIVDVLDELDYAVTLGVVSTPAVAINGKLAFTGSPLEDNLRRRLQEHLSADAQLANRRWDGDEDF